MEAAERLLITGGSGRIGHRCCVAAAQLGLQVHATMLTCDASLPGVVFHGADLADRRALHDLLDTVRPSGVLHLAALIRQTDPLALHRVNVEATDHLAQWCAVRKVHLCHASTDLVFDGTRGNYREDDPVNPQGPYAESKLLAELAVRASGADAAVARLPINYGWSRRTGSFSDWLLGALAREGTVALFSDQYRSPILLDNLAQVLMEIMTRKLTGLYHVGGADRVSRYELGRAIVRSLGIPEERVRPAPMSEVSYEGTRCADVSMDITRAAKTLATPLLGIREGVRLLAEGRPDRPA